MPKESYIKTDFVIKQGSQIFVVPAAAGGARFGEVVIDLSKIPFHIFQYSIVLVSNNKVAVYKNSRGIPLIVSSGFDGAGCLRFDGIPDPRWRRIDTIPVYNYDVVDAQIMLVYDYLQTTDGSRIQS